MDKSIYDFLSKFDAGVNSGISVLDLPANQLAFGLNTTIRGGYVHPRPVWMKKTLDYGGDVALQAAFENTFFQGMTKKAYRPDFGQSSIIAQVAGRQFKLTETTDPNWLVTEITIPGDPNDATTSQVWIDQAEKWAIIKDGSAKLPIFYDGTSSRRSYGPAQVLGTANAFVPANPPAIGATVTVTLNAPYTGPFDVPVLFNGAFYQPIANAGGGYGITLKQLYDPAGSIPAGTDITVIPAIVGLQAFTVNIPVAGIPYGPGGTGQIITFTKATTVAAGTKITFLGQTWNVPFGSTNSTTVFVQNTTNFTWPAQLPAGTQYLLASGAAPNVILGQLFSAFTPPGVGMTGNATMTMPYTGVAGQVVYIGTGQYEITAVPPPAPGVSLTLINLTDTVTATPYVNPSDILSVPELPAGRMGAYGQYHYAMSLVDGISFIYGDTVGGPSGTPANNYRDAVLKTTESELLIGQGAFRIPNSGEIITSMTFTANLDAALGQGPLQIGTSISMFSCVVSNDRNEWVSSNGPILPMSLIGKGPLAQNSTGLANSDTIFRQYDGLGSLILARRDFSNGWGNTPISREMDRIFSRDNRTLLSYGSEANFDNRRLDTASPQVSNQGVFHVGQCAINFDPLSNLREKKPSVWDGVWTGINVLQWCVGTFNGIERCFALTFNVDLQKIELYELLREGSSEYLDNGVTRIFSAFETPAIFHPQKRSIEIPLVQLKNGVIHLDKGRGNVHVRVMYRPDFYPCWTVWHERDVCFNTTAENAKPGYIDIGLGEPSIQPCNSSNGRPLVIGRFHQLRIEIEGQYEFMGGEFEAVEIPTMTFPVPVCETQDCKIINCETPDDLRQYNLQGLPALPLPNIPVNLVGNNPVYYSFQCETGQINFDGTLPSWIILDLENSRLLGAANTFFANSLVLANQSAQSALNAFAAAAIEAGTLNCGGGTASCSGTDTNRYQISPYVDGDVANASGNVPSGGEVVFDGTFPYKNEDNSCFWMATYFGGPSLLMDGLTMCTIEVAFSAGQWTLRFFNDNVVGGLWVGTKTTGSTPAGIYTLQSGPDVAPLTLTIISIGGITTNQPRTGCIPS